MSHVLSVTFCLSPYIQNMCPPHGLGGHGGHGGHGGIGGHGGHGQHGGPDLEKVFDVPRILK